MSFLKFEKVEGYKFNDINLKISSLNSNILNKAEQVIKHVKKHKKSYKMMVIYLALLMAPHLYEYSKYEIINFIKILASMREYMSLNEIIKVVTNELYQIILNVVKSLAILTFLIELVNSLFPEKYQKG